MMLRSRIALLALLASSGSAQTLLYYGDRQTYDRFGSGVGFDEGRVVVGSPARNNDAGGFHLYEKLTGEWEFKGVEEHLAVPGDEFGEEVELYGDWVLVSAPGENGHGRVHLFERTHTEWTHRQTLDPINPVGGERFGQVIDLDGDRLAVGCHRDSNALQEAGAVYVYKLEGDTWELEQLVLHADPRIQDYFGYSFDLNGENLFVGAYQDDISVPGEGTATLYAFDGSSWMPTHLIKSPMPHVNGFYGRGVAFSGEWALVGEDGSGACPWGQAHLYRRNGNTLEFERTLCSVHQWPSAGEGFGNWVTFHEHHPIVAGIDLTQSFRYGVWDTAIFTDRYWDLEPSGSRIAIGSGYREWPFFYEGGVHLWEASDLFPEAVTAYCHCDAGPCEDDPEAGCVNTTGIGARLGLDGSVSVQLDDLTLRATNLPLGQLGMMLMGDGQSATPVGSGEYCIASGALGVFRFPIQGTGLGTSVLGPGLVEFSVDQFNNNGTIHPGQTWHFQYWYRDPGGPCGGSSNFTNALSVTFAP